ncbi:class I SAM-dependent methyltransferase [Candidatus Dojkabacteria bacterium]|nr:class I SAM-dependent methyltransferase [Candidatus Dojkabacteria bacterium]
MENRWERIAKKYFKSVKQDDHSDYAYEKYINTPSLLSLCNIEGDSVLDLGCGDGRFTKKLEDEFSDVYAVDYSNQMLIEAKKLCKRTVFTKSDLENKFPYKDNSFNLVTGKLLLMYIEDLDNISKESFRVLKSGGALVVSVTHPLKWISEQINGNVAERLYKGYLSEAKISGNIAKDKDLPVEFINRTVQTYINTFTKQGFVLEILVETGVSDAFVIKYPQYLDFQHKPFRLNMKFIKR